MKSLKLLGILLLVFVTSCSNNSVPKDSEKLNTSEIPKKLVIKTTVDNTLPNKNIDSEKSYTNIMDEYYDIIKSDSDYNLLKTFGDRGSEKIKDTAKAFCNAKEKGLEESAIKQYQDDIAERDSKSFGDSDTAKRLLIKVNDYSAKLGKKYYCS